LLTKSKVLSFIGSEVKVLSFISPHESGECSRDNK
jgi:hypothetical protein